MTTPEGRVKAYVKRRLDEEFGRRCYRFMPVQNGMGKPGLDFFLCIDGFFVAIETKTTKTKHMTPRQETTAAEIAKAGGHVYVIYDKATCEDAIEDIKNKFFVHTLDL